MIGKFGSIDNKFSVDDVGFLRNLKNKIAARGHRPDIYLVSSKVEGTEQVIEVGFHPHVGKPNEQELRAFVERNYPQTKINWKTLQDTGNNRLRFSIVSDAEVIPVSSVDRIPPAFTPIGTGIYKRASDESVWHLRKEGEDLILVRQYEDTPPDDLKVGTPVLTSLGEGVIVDKSASSIDVKFNSGEIRTFAPKDVFALYDRRKEKKLLEEYYEKAFANKEFAKSLVMDYGRAKE